ncbi:MAG: cysteine desulfurase [Candidatus Omnitrophica bacterium]|nr:cysteine desulfurase [Candidatus Omnitrophota bacterium]
MSGLRLLSTRINLDHSSGTPLLPEVKQVMAAVEEGNPSSIHQAGQRAKQRLEQARKQVALLINAKPEEISFTSCGTESNNWALRGLFSANKRKGNHIVISAIEHPSVSLVARRLELDGGAKVTILPVDGEGVVQPSALKAAMTPQTVLVSIMLANGEVGTIEPIKELAAIAHEQGALFHTDAVAAVGSIPVDVKALGVDALSLAANQFGGPQGTAVLFVREGVRILPLLEGGGQETGGRSGTEALSAVVGLAAAAGVATRDLPQRVQRLSALRNRLHDGLKERMEGLRINGPMDFRRVARLPHNLHVCVDGVASESLVLGLDAEGIAAGLGSACNSKAMRPSHVLKAMGLSDEEAKGALVLTLGVQTTDDEIDRALEIIPTVVQRLRNVTALTSR